MRLLLVLAALLAATPALAGDAAAGDSFDLGRGPQGEYCRAERLWNAPGVTGLFDKVFSIRCRGWTDTLSVGRLYAVTDTPEARAAVAKARPDRLSCGAAVAVTLPGIGPGEGARCEYREGGFTALAVSAGRGKTFYAGEGLDRFSRNIAAGLAALAGGPIPASTMVPKDTLDLGKAPAPPAGVASATAVDLSALDGRSREAIDYSVRGQNVEAREIITRSQGRLPANAPAGEQAALRLEAALSESNLGNYEVAKTDLDRAALLLTGPGAPQGLGGDLLRAKLPVYRALLSLNERAFADARRHASEGLESSRSIAAAASVASPDAGKVFPLSDRSVLNELNARGATARAAGLRLQVLRVQSWYVKGAAERELGLLSEASASQAAARDGLEEVERSGADPTNLQWLFSQIDTEQARLALATGRRDAAGPLLVDAVARLERTAGYAGSPILAQRKLALANYLVDRGDKAGALAAYDGAIAVMRAGGPSAATSGATLEGYFVLLEEQGRGEGPAAVEARGRFFLAAQMINPPAVAAQIAQLQKVFESGTSEGAVLAKTLQDLDREQRVLSVQIAALPDQAGRERSQLQQALDANGRRTAEVRRQLSGDQRYLQANDSAVTLAELQKVLKPDEAYARLLTLPRRSFMIVVTSESAGIYQLGKTTPELAEAVTKLRKSIDGYVGANGRVVPLVYDIPGAKALYDELLGPAAPLLAGKTAIITEPTGAMTQLPFGVLVPDQDSVDWFATNVKKNSRDYSKVRFLATRYELGTSVSPRAFLVARSLPPSRAAHPYIGFGNHAVPTDAELASLAGSELIGHRCAARLDDVRNAFATLKPIGAKELAVAAQIAGPGSKVVQGEAFTDKAVTAPGQSYIDYAVVHFATHGLKEGELGCDNPPALLTSIAPDGGSDGLLSFEKIANLKFDANLVVLSACNTAAETTVTRATGSAGFLATSAAQGATLSGLVRAFFVAGSRTVLATHWAIPDGFKTSDGRNVPAATALVEALFRDGGTDSIAAALRKAQTGMIANADTSHPYYWGAFAIVGDGKKLMFARAADGGKNAGR
jgi:CHAT domain-containing protein